MTARKPPSDLTDRVYAAIVAYDAANGYPPTLEEIGERVYLSKSGVFRHVCKLVQAGRLLREPGAGRGLTIVQEAGR